MRWFMIIPLFLVPLSLMAEEAVSEIPALPDGSPGWLVAIWPILFLTVIPFIISFLNKRGQEHKARADAAKADEKSTLSSMKNEFLDKRLIPFLYESGAHLSKTKLPELILDIADGGKFDWKKHTKEIGIELKNLAIEKFKVEGVDLVKELGDKYLDSLIERAILQAVPFLPKVARPTVEDKADDAAKFIEDLILDKGLDYVNNRWLNGDLENK